MSDKSEGPGWWIASDGKWYPPELHPSVRDASSAESDHQTVAAAHSPSRAQNQKPGQKAQLGQARDERPAHVGPQFPDLFQKALEGSHLADNVSVKYDGDDERNVPSPGPAGRTGGGPTRARSGGAAQPAAAGATFGASAKRRWRKGR